MSQNGISFVEGEQSRHTPPLHMKVLGTDKIERFIKQHAQSRNPLKAWLAETERTEWATPQDIRNRYRSADFLADNRVIFNIKGNDFRLVVKVQYRGQIVLIEWVGTHAEYDRKNF
jgi:mRNA interferase HigB